MGKNVFVLISVLILICIVSVSNIHAQEYYADLILDVQEDGSVEVSGITNDLSLAPGTYQEFTSKKGIYWLLNISSDKIFSDYVVTIILPDGSEFNYLKTNGRSRVSYDSGIKIIASGTDSLNILVQYHIDHSKKSLLWLWLILAGAGLIIIGFFSWRKFFKKISSKKISAQVNTKTKEKTKETMSEKVKSKVIRSKSNSKNNNSNDEYVKIRIIKKTLAESQEKIVDLLLDAGGELVQKQLQHRSGLPKATLSRNIDVLSKKSIIIKQSRGMTNMIMLNKELDVGQK